MFVYHFTVHQVNPVTGISKRKLFTGYYGECLDAIRFLVTKKDWNQKHISLIDNVTQKAQAFRL